MGSLFKCFFIFSIINLQIEGRYERHNQFCGGMNGSDIKWSLEIKENKTYVFQITKRKNEYLSKPKTTLLSGTWQIANDTLKLYQFGKMDNALMFVMTEDKLVFQNNKLMLSNNKMTLPSKDLLFLDYLSKP